MLDHEIQAFGHRLGLEALVLSREGRARLDVENVGSFHLELADEGGRRELLVYLAVPLPPHDAAAPRRLLELCDYRSAFPMHLAAGVFSGRGILLTRMAEGEVTAARLENAFRFLSELFHGAALARGRISGA